MSFEIKKVPTVEDQKIIYKYTYGPDEAKIFYNNCLLYTSDAADD